MKKYVSAAALRGVLMMAMMLCGGGAGAFAQSLPSPWMQSGIGAPKLAGSASVSSETFRISAAGTDIWSSSDQFHFVYQPVTGDVEIVARLDALDAVYAFTNAGVMIRSSLAAEAAHGYTTATISRGVYFRRRLGDGASTTAISGPKVAAPVWLRLVRIGSVLTSYASMDGTTWTRLGASTVSLGSTAYVGLAVTSHKTSVRATALMSQVRVTPLGGGTLPAGQQSADVGAPESAGRATYASGVYTVNAAGADIWGLADQFHYVYQPITGDTEIVARVRSITQTNDWAKAGVMLRESLTASSRHAMVVVSPARGYAFQRRPETGGYSVHTSGGSGTAPGWVKLVRAGDLFTAFRSDDGTAWMLIGSDVIPMGDTVYAGLAVTSHDAAPTTATIDNLGITAAAPGNQAPAVSIISPVNGTTLESATPVTITAAATDPESRMLSVDFYVGSALLARDTTAPFSANWSPGSAGAHALTAVAHDADGRSSTSAAVNVTVNDTVNQPPVVSLATGGTSFTAPAALTLTATATDPDGQIARVEFYSGATRLATDSAAPYSFSWSGVAAGVYTLTAVAFDGAGLSATSSPVVVTVQAANLPPAITLSTGGVLSFVAPATVTLTAAASDPEGRLARVEFFNGATRLATDTAAPYGFSWSNVPAGVYSLTAIAYDAEGASATSAALVVTVTAAASLPPSAVGFTASSDHASNVSNYVLRIFAATANPLTSAPIATSDLGKPTPASNGDIVVDRSAFFSALATGNYVATVTAVGAGGETQSSSVAFTR